MLLRCNQGCKLSDGTTEGALDPDTDEVICNKCVIELDNVASFTKRTMRSNGDVLKKVAKAFYFDCVTCKKKVATSVTNGVLSGIGCKNKCAFNISQFMINSMNTIDTNDEEDDYGEE